MLSVELDTLRFTSKSNIFPEAGRLIRAALAGAGYDGTWNLRPVQQITARAPDIIKWLDVKGPRALRVRVKPGGNDSVWEYHLQVPPEYSAISVLSRLDSTKAQSDLIPAAVASVVLKPASKSQPEAPPAKAPATIVAPSPKEPVPFVRSIENSASPTASHPVMSESVGFRNAREARDLLDKVRLALERTEARQGEQSVLEARRAVLQSDIEKIRQKMAVEIEDVTNAIKAVDAELLELMSQEEADTEAQEAATWLAMVHGMAAIAKPKL